MEVIHEKAIENQVLVKEVMSSPVISVNVDACIPLVASLMDHYPIGCVLITNEEGEPVGIITQKDLVVRVLTKIPDESFVIRILGGDERASMLTAGDVMTSPVVVITPEKNLVETARKMRQHDIRRLGVVSKGKIVGIVSERDILSVTPAMIEILREEKRIAGILPKDYLGQVMVAGLCEECDNWSTNLTESNGLYLCEECV